MKKIILGGLIAASIFSCQDKKAPQKADKPNIVFLLQTIKLIPQFTLWVMKKYNSKF